MSSDIRQAVVRLPDGRDLTYAMLGASDGPAVIFHHGTPGASFTHPDLDAAALRTGLRVLAPTRSGYGDSTRDAGRSVASVVPDTLAMLDAQGIGRFATVGWSGGGPHALACAALAPDRCVSALSLAGVAPYLPGEFDWLEGMGEDNVEEFTLAMQAGPRYDESLEAARELLLAVDSTTVTSARDLFGSLVSDVDNDAASKEDVRFVCDLAQRGIRSGVGGWRDDDQSFLHPWGFDVDSIDVPVGVWFGDHDLMVPPRHGEWLVEHLGRVTPKHVHDGGHLSIVFGHFDEILGEVRQLAGGSW